METNVIMETSNDEMPKQAPNSSPEVSKRFKLCVIENGEIRIPEETTEKNLMSNLTQCLLKKEEGTAGGPITEKLIDNSLEKCLKETLSAEKMCIPPEVEAHDFNVQIEDCSDDEETGINCEASTEEVKEEEEEESVPKVDSVNMMNQLLDYYRTFNERQMGLTVDDNAPFYKPSKEPPVNVVCDNNIIKEAMLRVGKKIEAGETIKEPTIIEIESDDEQYPVVTGWRAMELEEERQKHTSVTIEEEEEEDDSPSEMLQFEEMINQLKARQMNGGDCPIGSNSIEKTLQRNIDAQNQEENRTKWDKRDIKNLVGILSEKLGRKSNIDYNKDDLFHKLDVITYDSKDFTGDSLFERLKRGEDVYDDSLDLEDMVVENAFQYTTERVVSRHKKVYHGGDELEVLFDNVKNIVSLRWLWNVYERTANKLLYRLKAEKLQYGRETEKSSWLKWKTRFSRLSWLIDWLPLSWKITGKPIYKQMTYPDTEWKTNETDDAGVKNVLKNRRRQRVAFSEGQNCSSDTEKTDDFAVNTESVAINLAEDESDSEDWEDEVEESEAESSDDDVIGNFRKMRSQSLEDRPLTGTLYIQRPDGKLVFNFNHNLR